MLNIMKGGYIVKNNLKNNRIEKKLSQAKLAKLADISERQYIRIEKGEQDPKTQTSLKIAKILESKVEDLFPIQKQ